MLLGIWHFVCKSHVDIKRVYCRFGKTVANTTALKSMTDASMTEMKVETETASSRGEVEHCICLDNVQEHDKLWEQGIGRVSRTKLGTAGTKIKLHGCAPKAFDAPDYYERAARKERKTLTVSSLFDNIDWEHERQTQRLLVSSSTLSLPSIRFANSSWLCSDLLLSQFDGSPMIAPSTSFSRLC